MTIINEEASSLTTRLCQWNCGNENAWDSILTSIYDELKRKARHLLVQHSQNYFQPTMLVHELYLHFQNQKEFQWKNRRHFYAVIAITMRRIIINEVTRKNALKRGGDKRFITTLSGLKSKNKQLIDLIDLDRALNKMEKIDEQSCRIIELRFFAGLSIDDVADALQISSRTVSRKLIWGKTWLFSQLKTPKKLLSDGEYDQVI